LGHPVVVASLLRCCAIKENVTVASPLYVVADVQFTVEKEGPLELLQFIQNITYNLGNSVPNIAIMLGFSSQLPLVLLPVRGVFETKTDQELPKIWYEHLAVEKSCHTVCRATVDR